MVSKEQDWKLRFFAITRTRSNIAASIDKSGLFVQLFWFFSPTLLV